MRWEESSAVLSHVEEVGFKGFLIDDHAPHMVDDPGWGYRGRAWSTGYIKALIDAVNALV